MLTHLKIKYKLILMLFLPILGLVYFVSISVLEKYQVAGEMSEIEQLAELSVKIATLVHQLQLERGFSGVFLDSQGKKFLEEIRQNRINTDQALHELNQMETGKFDDVLQTMWQQALSKVATLSIERQRVDELKVTEKKVIETYTEINQALLDLIQYIATLSQHPEIIRLEWTYAIFLASKDLAGLERSALATVFNKGYFTIEEYQSFIELMAEQHFYRRVLLKLFATPEQWAFFEQQANKTAFLETQKIRDQALALGIQKTEVDSPIDVDVQKWLTLQTQKINFLKEVENKLATDLHDKASAIQKTAYFEFLLVIGATLLLMIIVGTLVYLVLRGMTRPLNKAVSIANAIATGHLNNIFEIKGKDEISQLLQALQKMQTQLSERIERDRQIAEAALRINQALDNVTTPILILDPNCRIIYLNQAAQHLLADSVEQIRKELPYFNPHDLLEKSIDIFPLQHIEVLNNLMSTDEKTVVFGQLILKTFFTPVLNDDKQRLGFVIELNNQTLEKAIEQEINTVISSASQGDFSSRINLIDKIGFFETFSGRINVILELNQNMIRDIMQMFSALAQGNLTQNIIGNYSGDFEQLKQDANATVQKLTEVMLIIKQTAQIVNTASEELSQGNISLNQRTEEQAASLEQIAASMQQMTSTIQQNANNAKQASELAKTARAQAEQGGEVVWSAVQAISEINASSQKITDIIGMINEIAFQTNLLALNAAVEAARAGEQGRGFAVVASEVRNLAQRSASAAKEIKELIQESVRKVEEGTRLANRSGEALGEIVTASQLVNDIIADISTASQQQAVGIQYVNQAITQMDTMTQQNGALVEQATKASQSLSEQAQRLNQQVAFFKLNLLSENKALIQEQAKVSASTGNSSAHPPVYSKPKPKKTSPPVINRSVSTMPSKKTTALVAEPALIKTSATSYEEGWEDF